MPPPAGEFLALLNEADRQDLEAIGRRQTADRGDVLLARGEVGDRVLVVETGRVKVSVTTSSGREVVDVELDSLVLGPDEGLVLRLG